MTVKYPLTIFKLPFDTYHYIQALEKLDIVLIDNYGELEVKEDNKEINLNTFFDSDQVSFAPSIESAVSGDHVVYIPYDLYAVRNNENVSPKNTIEKELELFRKLGMYNKYKVTSATDADFTIFVDGEYLTFEKKEYRQLWLIKNIYTVNLKKKGSERMNKKRPIKINRLRKKRAFLTKEVRERYINMLEVGDAYLKTSRCLFPVKEDWELDVTAVPSMHQVEIGDTVVYLPFDKPYPEHPELMKDMKRTSRRVIQTWGNGWRGYRKELEVLEEEVRYTVIDYNHETLTVVNGAEVFELPFYDYVELYLIKNVERLRDFNESADRLFPITEGLILALQQMEELEDPSFIKTSNGDETFDTCLAILTDEFPMILEDMEYSTNFTNKSSFVYDLNNTFHSFVVEILSEAGRFGVTRKQKDNALEEIKKAFDMVEKIIVDHEGFKRRNNLEN